MILVEIPVSRGLPEKPGKYLVATETNFLKKRHKLEATLHISKKEDGSFKHTWDVNNQNVTHWYKELPNVDYNPYQ